MSYINHVRGFFTKPLQGALFQKFRDVLMGYKPITILKQKSFEIKERVENTDENTENIHGNCHGGFIFLVTFTM